MHVVLLERLNIERIDYLNDEFPFRVLTEIKLIFFLNGQEMSWFVHDLHEQEIQPEKGYKIMV